MDLGSIKNLEDSFLKWQFKSSMSFSSKMRMRIYRRISRYLKSGLPLDRALKSIFKNESEDGTKKKRPTAAATQDWINRVREGQPLDQAMSEWIPSRERIVIASGVASGKLPDALESVIFVEESMKKINSSIIGAFLYPLFILVATFFVLSFFATDVLPLFDAILSRDNWTGSAAYLAVLANFVNEYSLYLAGTIITLFSLSIWSLPRWTGAVRQKFDALPPWSFYKMIVGAGFMLSLSSMISSGTPMVMALRRILDISPPWYAEKLRAAIGFVSNGSNVGEALYQAGHNFPNKETVRDLREYAVLDGFEEMLNLIAREWVLSEVDRVQKQSEVIRNISMLVMAMVVGFVAFGFYDLQNQISAGIS